MSRYETRYLAYRGQVYQTSTSCCPFTSIGANPKRFREREDENETMHTRLGLGNRAMIDHMDALSYKSIKAVGHLRLLNFQSRASLKATSEKKRWRSGAGAATNTVS